MTTGWPAPALAQDECRPLFKWFADKPDARQLVREHCQTIKEASMALSNKHSECAQCGMVCTPNEYHPYAACLMFMACKDGDTVRSNIEALRAQDTALIEAQAREIAALKEQVEGLRKALAPFAAYERVRSTMGGCTPKEGIIWACHARAGRAEITVEDMNAAVAAMAAKGGSDG